MDIFNYNFWNSEPKILKFSDLLNNTIKNIYTKFHISIYFLDNSIIARLSSTHPENLI